MAKLQKLFAITFAVLIFQVHLNFAFLGLIGNVISAILSPLTSNQNQFANQIPSEGTGAPNTPTAEVNPYGNEYLPYLRSKTWQNYNYPTIGIAGAFSIIGQSIAGVVQGKSKFQSMQIHSFSNQTIFVVLRCFTCCRCRDFTPCWWWNELPTSWLFNTVSFLPI